MNARAALIDALLTTLTAPATWPIALATFLLRGGVVLVALPIVVLPSPVGLGNALLPTLMELAFQGISETLVATVAVAILAFVVWIVGGGLLAARLELEATRLVAASEVLADRSDRNATLLAAGVSPGVRVPARIMAGRLIAHAPTATVIALGSARLAAVGYRELTSPLDVSTPIVWRVLGGAPEVIAAFLATWAVGEITGALAARRLAAGDPGVLHALGGALVSMALHPISTLAAFGIPTAGLLLVAIPAGLAAAASWTAVRVALQGPDDALWGTLAVVAFVALWVVGLGLIAVISAWRAAVWTVAEPLLRRNLASSRVTETG